MTQHKVPGFLDTLAEAYYSNDAFADAIETESEALAAKPQNSEYKGRLDKYRKAKEKVKE